MKGIQDRVNMCSHGLISISRKVNVHETRWVSSTSHLLNSLILYILEIFHNESLKSHMLLYHNTCLNYFNCHCHHWCQFKMIWPWRIPPSTYWVLCDLSLDICSFQNASLAPQDNDEVLLAWYLWSKLGLHSKGKKTVSFVSEFLKRIS